VNEAVPETGRFDADANRRPANRDVLQFGRNQRQKSMLKAMGDDRFERRETFDLQRLRGGVEPDDLIELAERDSPFGTAA
jgi:hypothetical protein